MVGFAFFIFIYLLVLWVLTSFNFTAFQFVWFVFCCCWFCCCFIWKSSFQAWLVSCFVLFYFICAVALSSSLRLARSSPVSLPVCLAHTHGRPLGKRRSKNSRFCLLFFSFCCFIYFLCGFLCKAKQLKTKKSPKKTKIKLMAESFAFLFVRLSFELCCCFVGFSLSRFSLL